MASRVNFDCNTDFSLRLLACTIFSLLLPASAWSAASPSSMTLLPIVLDVALWEFPVTSDKLIASVSVLNKNVVIYFSFILFFFSFFTYSEIP